jgi:hypothetical protein
LTSTDPVGSNARMSVKMILRIPVDPAAMQRAAGENDAFLGIAQHARENGAIHHEFWAGNGEVLAVDEWESAEAFQAFWDNQGQNIGQLMAAAQASEPAPPDFYEKMSLGDEF